MKNELFSGKGSKAELERAAKKVMSLDMLTDEQRKQILQATVDGTGRPISFHEAAVVYEFIFHTLVQGSVLGSILAGNLDLRVEDDDTLSFATTEQGEREAKKRILGK